MARNDDDAIDELSTLLITEAVEERESIEAGAFARGINTGRRCGGAGGVPCPGNNGHGYNPIFNLADTGGPSDHAAVRAAYDVARSLPPRWCRACAISAAFGTTAFPVDVMNRICVGAGGVRCTGRNGQGSTSTFNLADTGGSRDLTAVCAARDEARSLPPLWCLTCADSTALGTTAFSVNVKNRICVGAGGAPCRSDKSGRGTRPNFNLADTGGPSDPAAVRAAYDVARSLPPRWCRACADSAALGTTAFPVDVKNRICAGAGGVRCPGNNGHGFQPAFNLADTGGPSDPAAVRAAYDVARSRPPRWCRACADSTALGTTAFVVDRRK